ncbi:ALA-interacting subunit 1-like [Salvia hispanica]|uniref:ALA-interacting subunit 1-like n=1 Tax=Salvia hispanica TaxID=49212 RepID=UPI0020092C43|nr:ALA-interacting subunit 1-like [Salvia hispanica]
MIPDGSSQASNKISKKPTYSRFTQQDLPAWKPILTPALVIATLVCLAIIFIPIGLFSLSASKNVVEVVDRYDDACIPSPNQKVGYIKDPATNKTCIRSITIPKKMRKPIYVYYQLDNFYQNHRRYVKSRSDRQLWNPKAESRTTQCDPEGQTGDGKPIVPCGLVAWSLFNDTYMLSKNDAALPINKKDIAWRSDRIHKFGENIYPKNFQNGTLIGGGKLDESIPMNQQEDLMVWMRTAALPTFRKLYGKIETDLEANEKITVTIQNNYNTYSFHGKKKLVVSTATWIGGKNDFIGRMYMAVGGTSLVFAIIFSLLYVFKPRPLGNPSYLSWNKNNTI